MSKDAKYYWSRFAVYALFLPVRAALMTGLFLLMARVESGLLGNPTAVKTAPIIFWGGSALVAVSLIVSLAYARGDLHGLRDARLRRRLEPDYFTRYLEARDRNDLEALKDYEDDRELPKRLALHTAYR